MGGSHLFLRESVTGTLVLSDLVHVGIDSQLVERAAKEHYVRGETDGKEFAGRRYENLVASRGNVIVLVKAGLHVSVDGFSRRAKVFDCPANFFRLRPTRVRHVDVQHHGGDALVDFRFAELRQQAAEGLRLTAKDASYRIVGNVVRQGSGDFQREHAVVTNRWSIASKRRNYDCDG